MSINDVSFRILVVPHITEAIQEWVERVANQPVTENSDQPDVIS